MKKGKFLWFNKVKGYGVILTDDGVSYFAHQDEIMSNILPEADGHATAKEIKVRFTPDDTSNKFRMPTATRIELTI